MDTWMFVRDIEINGERNRGLYILKSRGTAHSNQIREFVLTDSGVDLIDVYIGPGGVLTGTARKIQEVQERDAILKREQETSTIRRNLEIKRKNLEAKIAELQAEFQNEQHEIEKSLVAAEQREKMLAQDRKDMARARKADIASNGRRPVNEDSSAKKTKKFLGSTALRGRPNA
jgi:circadian clock protein KaiC